MAQKLFAPFKKIPHQVQKVPFIKKAMDIRHKVKSDVFGCHLSSTFGFPDQPSAIAYDPSLKIIAIGTHQGDLKILGGPGVEFHGVHANGDEVSKIVFIPNEGRLISLTADNKLHLWEFDDVASPPIWNEIKILDLGDKEGCRVTCLCLNHDGSTLYFGTEKSLLQEIDVKEWKLRAESLLEEGEELHDKLGEMISLEMHPIRELLLAGFSKGTTLIIDITTAVPATVVEETKVENTVEAKEETPAEEDKPASEEKKDETAVGDEEKKTDDTAEVPKNEEKKDEDAAPVPSGEENKTENATPAVEEKKPEDPVAATKVVSYATKTHVCVGHQSLENASWMCDHEFVASYSDGSFLTWKVDLDVPDLSVSNQTPPTTPYGPFPCKAINKVMIKNTGSGALTIFSGGMPKATHSDKHTVSVIGHNCSTDLSDHVSDHVCFEFSSQVIDFVTIDSATPPTAPPADDDEHQHNHVDHTAEKVVSKISALLVMLEHELVAIDLLTPEWPLFKLPYLSSINSSCVTAIGHAEKVPEKVVDILKSSQEPASTASSLPWPIYGGMVKEDSSPKSHDLLITGHEDGSVCLWHLCSGDVFSRLATIKTAPLYVIDNQETQAKSSEDDAWPPFRRVGNFTPISEESRLVVTRVALVCQPDSEDAALIVGGMAGQVSLWTLSAEAKDVEVDVIKVVADVIEDKSAFVWHSSDGLKVHEGELHFKGGFQPDTLVQIEPAAEVTALAYQPSWQLLAVGGAHGYIVVDTQEKKMVYSNATVFATHEIQPGAAKDPQADSLMSKSRQLQKSLRQSFKRFKKMVPKPSTPSKTPKSKDAAPVESKDAEQKPGTSEEATKKEEVTAVAASEEAPKEEQAGAEAAAAEPVAVAAEVVEEEAKPAEEEAKKENESKTSKPSRMRSFLRSSFRSKNKEKVEENAAPAESGDAEAAAPAAAANVPEAKEPVTLNSGDVTTALIRCMLFTDTYVRTVHDPRTPSLWVGTQAGIVIIHEIVVNRGDSSAEAEQVQVKPLKQIALQHKAPVVGLSVIDTKTKTPVKITGLVKAAGKSESPAPGTTPTAETDAAATAEDAPVTAESGEAAGPAEPPASTKKVAAPSTPATPSHVEHHDLIVCSEEQVKIFSLPKLKPKYKYKVLSDKSVSVGGDSGDIEAQTGTIERSQLTRAATIDRSYLDGGSVARHRIKTFGVQLFKHGGKDEWNVVVALADSFFYILSLPNMRKQMNGNFTTEKESFLPLTFIGNNDANVILTLSGMGQVRATDISQNFPSRYGANCILPLPEGVRPKRQEEAPPAPVAAAAPVETKEEEVAKPTEDGETPAENKDVVVEEVAAVEDTTTELDKAATVSDDNAAIESLAIETVESAIEDAKKEAVDILVLSHKTVDEAMKEAMSEFVREESDDVDVVICTSEQGGGALNDNINNAVDTNVDQSDNTVLDQAVIEHDIHKTDQSNEAPPSDKEIIEEKSEEKQSLEESDKPDETSEEKFEEIKQSVEESDKPDETSEEKFEEIKQSVEESDKPDETSEEKSEEKQTVEESDKPDVTSEEKSEEKPEQIKQSEEESDKPDETSEEKFEEKQSVEESDKPDETSEEKFEEKQSIVESDKPDETIEEKSEEKQTVEESDKPDEISEEKSEEKQTVEESDKPDETSEEKSEEIKQSVEESDKPDETIEEKSEEKQTVEESDKPDETIEEKSEEKQTVEESDKPDETIEEKQSVEESDKPDETSEEKFEEKQSVEESDKPDETSEEKSEEKPEQIKQSEEESDKSDETSNVIKDEHNEEIHDETKLDGNNSDEQINKNGLSNEMNSDNSGLELDINLNKNGNNDAVNDEKLESETKGSSASPSSENSIVEKLEQLDYVGQCDPSASEEEGGNVNSVHYVHDLHKRNSSPEAAMCFDHFATPDSVVAPPSSSGDTAGVINENAVDNVTDKLGNVQLEDEKDTSNQHIGDITMDCIKEYANNENGDKSDKCNDSAAPTKTIDDDDDLKKPAANETLNESATPVAECN